MTSLSLHFVVFMACLLVPEVKYFTYGFDQSTNEPRPIPTNGGSGDYWYSSHSLYKENYTPASTDSPDEDSPDENPGTQGPSDLITDDDDDNDDEDSRDENPDTQDTTDVLTDDNDDEDSLGENPDILIITTDGDTDDDVQEGTALNTSVVSCSMRCPVCSRCPKPRICHCPLIPPCPDIPACPGECSPCPDCPRCLPKIPAGYEYNVVTGHYYRFHDVPVNWYEAKITCEHEGAHLIIINSQTEANLAMRYLILYHQSRSSIHVGFHDIPKEGIYTSIFGESLNDTGFHKWSPGQPDDHKNEDCGAFDIRGGLSDIPCTRQQGFICELPL